MVDGGKASILERLSAFGSVAWDRRGLGALSARSQAPVDQAPQG